MHLTKTEEAFLTSLREQGENGCDRTRLALLCQNPTEPRDHAFVSNVVDAHIKNLRKKLKDTKESIVSIRRYGYKLVTV